MSGTLSGARKVGLEEGTYVVRSEPTATVDALPDSGSATPSLARRTRNMMLPVLVGLASIGGPTPPGVRRVFSAASISQSGVLEADWGLARDGWQYTEEWANAEEVMALNALLHLPTVIGLDLGLE